MGHAGRSGNRLHCRDIRRRSQSGQEGRGRRGRRLRPVLGGGRRSCTMARRRFGAPGIAAIDSRHRLRLSGAAWVGSLGVSRLEMGAFLRFWYDVIIGDDWTIAASIAVALVLPCLLVRSNIQAWWLLPIAAVLTLGVSVWRAARRM